MPAPRRKHKFTGSDAAIALLLAARIHRSGAAVRKTAERIYKRATPEARRQLDLVLMVSDPLAMMDIFLKELQI